MPEHSTVTHLHVGRRKAGISIHPVPAYPKMYRVQLPDGRWSPMANMARAKDAAISHFTQARGRGLRPDEVVTWHPGVSPSEAPPEAVLSWLDPPTPSEPQPLTAS